MRGKFLRCRDRRASGAPLNEIRVLVERRVAPARKQGSRVVVGVRIARGARALEHLDVRHRVFGPQRIVRCTVCSVDGHEIAPNATPTARLVHALLEA